MELTSAGGGGVGSKTHIAAEYRQDAIDNDVPEKQHDQNSQLVRILWAQSLKYSRTSVYCTSWGVSHWLREKEVTLFQILLSYLCVYLISIGLEIKVLYNESGNELYRWFVISRSDCTTPLSGDQVELLVEQTEDIFIMNMKEMVRFTF